MNKKTNGILFLGWSGVVFILFTLLNILIISFNGGITLIGAFGIIFVQILVFSVLVFAFKNFYLVTSKPTRR